MLQFTQNTFKPEHQLTIGVEFGARNLTVGENIFRIQIWDTAGQERYHALTPMYYRNANAAVVVFDVSNVTSFERAQKWYEFYF